MVFLKHRERWSSRAAFILASMGAAIGYGNVWRFPSLVYKYGGGAFFIPYLMALFIIGIPIMALEVSLGQVYQSGDMGSFGAMHKRLRGVGLTSVQNSYFIVCYYCALITWTIRAFFDSFGTNVFEGGETEGFQAYEYFKNIIIGMETLPDDLMPTRLVPENVGYLCLTWVVIFFCIAFGIKWEGRITYFTAGFPCLLLFVFLGRGLTLDGSELGVQAYIGQWDLSVLTSQPEVWSVAVTQIFFSIGVTFGVMTAFGSHCEKNAPAFCNSVIIACSDSLFAVIAGFAVFGTCGHIVKTKGIAFEDLDLGGPALIFGVFPAALATLPGGIHWVRLLFMFMFLLGIDSGFALVQAVFTVAHDTVQLRHVIRWKLVMVTCIFGFICGLLYVTDAGFIFLDVVDFYINFIMILVGFFECFAAGWMWEVDDLMERLGKPAVLLYMFTTFSSVIIASILWFAVENINNTAAGFIALVVIYVVGMMGVLFLLSKTINQNPEWTWKSILYELYFRNVFELRDHLAETVGFLPRIWAVFIKHVLPPILLILFINLAAAKTKTGQSLFGHYEGYSTYPYQFLGILIVALTLFTLTIGFVWPSIYGFVALPEEEEYELKEATNREKQAALEEATDREKEKELNEFKDESPEVAVEKPIDSV